jgi:hypothetical protein
MRAAGIFITVLYIFAAYSQPKDRIREFFEWGEYDSLLIAIPAYCSGKSGAIDSSLLCDYYGYLGVAFFAKGGIADARGAFKQALECRASLTLDSQYITPEMLDLFTDTRREMEMERQRRHREDSIQSAAEAQRKSRERERAAAEQRAAQKNKLDGSFRRAAWLSGAILTFSAATAVTAAFEFSSGREYDRNFRSAAALGDLRTYDHYRDLLRRQNRKILGFSAVSVISGGIAAYYGFGCMRIHRARAAITIKDGMHGVILAFEF